MSFDFGIGDKVTLKREWAVYIHDLNRRLNVGEELTITSMERNSLSNIGSLQTGEAIGRCTLGFAECCDRCRSGHGHHNFLETGGVFEKVKDNKNSDDLPFGERTTKALEFGAPPTPEEESGLSQNGLRAWRVLEMVENLTSLWNPEDKDMMTLTTFSSYELQRVVSSDGKRWLKSTSVYASKDQVDLYSASIEGPDIPPYRQSTVGEPNLVPFHRIAPFLEYYKRAFGYIKDLKQQMAKFSAIAKELGLADEEQTVAEA